MKPFWCNCFAISITVAFLVVPIIASERVSSPKASKDAPAVKASPKAKYKLPDAIPAFCDSCEKGYLLKPLSQRANTVHITETNRIITLTVGVKCSEKHSFTVEFKKILPLK